VLDPQIAQLLGISSRRLKKRKPDVWYSDRGGIAANENSRLSHLQ
jgi:hypothetical protein